MLQESLLELANPEIAEHSQRFFKTGKGEYGEGDVFLGIRVPVLRKQAKKFKLLPIEEVLQSLTSSYHEERLCALLIMVLQFDKGDEKQREEIYQHYLAHTHYINNWDLVDTSAHPIVGGYLFDKPRDKLYELVVSESLWERRISMMSTYYFIKKNDFVNTLKLAGLLLDDQEDLIHKVTGWMLREVGKRDLAAEKDFLKQHYKTMPRTMLRYAIEKFPKKERQQYLNGNL